MIRHSGSKQDAPGPDASPISEPSLERATGRLDADHLDIAKLDPIAASLLAPHPQ
jgi:hypothetical protein